MTATYVKVHLDLNAGDGSEVFGTEQEDIDCLMMARIFDIVRGHEPAQGAR